MDLRSWQQVIDNIRERFAAVEATVRTRSTAVAAAPAAAGADLLVVIAALRRDLDSLAAALGAADLDDLAPAPRNARQEQEDLAPAGVSRSSLALLADRIEALELEPLR